MTEQVTTKVTESVPIDNAANLSKRAERQHYSQQQIIDALKAAQGFQTIAAETLHCNLATIWKYAKRYPAIQRAIQESRERKLDIAEAALHKNVLSGDTASICFFLKCQGKARGYIERSEISGPGGGPITMESKVYHYDVAELARTILEAERLGIPPQAIRGAIDGQSTPLLPAAPDVQATPVPQPHK